MPILPIFIPQVFVCANRLAIGNACGAAAFGICRGCGASNGLNAGGFS
jgi:hypothetical protein